MVKLTCEKCGNAYKIAVDCSDTSIGCKVCKHVMKVPIRANASTGFCMDVKYKADGMTPDFDELFQLLAKEEREAPEFINC